MYYKTNALYIFVLNLCFYFQKYSWTNNLIHVINKKINGQLTTA